MRHVVKVFLFGLTISALASCASPKVVQEEQPGDQALSCPQLQDAIDEAHNFERKARGERGATGTNVASALLFWPGLIATYSNSGDAISAAQERQHYLMHIWDKKNCDQQMAAEKAATQAAAVTETPSAIAHPDKVTARFVVESLSGAGAFPTEEAKGDPIYNYTNGDAVVVIESSPDKRWYKVVLPDGRTGFIPSALIKTDASVVAPGVAEKPTAQQIADASPPKHKRKKKPVTTEPPAPAAAATSGSESTMQASTNQPAVPASAPALPEPSKP